MIGIVGYGMVGKAVSNGFTTSKLISDPAYNDLTVEYMCSKGVDAIFVCVPTPTDDTNYSLLTNILDRIVVTGYKGLVIVKSTVLPMYLEKYDVVYNPEFLSRATADQDFIDPPFVLLGGPFELTKQVETLYQKHSTVNLNKVIHTDIKTAALAKYTMNSFYATKVTFMNQMYDIANSLGVDWNEITNILKQQPWMGTHHFQVPGPDGSRGFGGPCLPKDTQALVKEYDVPLLETVLELNKIYRNTKNGN